MVVGLPASSVIGVSVTPAVVVVVVVAVVVASVEILASETAARARFFSSFFRRSCLAFSTSKFTGKKKLRSTN